MRVAPPPVRGGEEREREGKDMTQRKIVKCVVTDRFNSKEVWVEYSDGKFDEECAVHKEWMNPETGAVEGAYFPPIAEVNELSRKAFADGAEMVYLDR